MADIPWKERRYTFRAQILYQQGDSDTCTADAGNAGTSVFTLQNQRTAPLPEASRAERAFY